MYCYCFKTLRPRQNGRHFQDDILNCIFLNGNVWISIKIPLKAPRSLINNIPLSETMMFSLRMNICVTRPQWVKKTDMLIHWACCERMFQTMKQRIFCPKSRGFIFIKSTSIIAPLLKSPTKTIRLAPHHTFILTGLLSYRDENYCWYKTLPAVSSGAAPFSSHSSQ